MKREPIHLTEEEVKTACFDPDGPDVQYLWDNETTGFGLRLYRSGKKAFCVGYRPAASGQMKFAVIGKVGQIKVKQARAKAARILANGEDPIQEKREQKAAVALQVLEAQRNPNVGELIDRYLAYQHKRQRVVKRSGGGKHLAPSTLQQYKWTIEKHIRPYWSDIPLQEIERTDVRVFIGEVADTNSDSVANNVLQRFRGLMNYALVEELLDRDPSEGVTTDYEYVPVERTLSVEEIRLFWFGLEASQIYTPIQLALKLLLVTAQRRSEIVTARWEWFDSEEQVLRIPRANVKNRRGANIVPLSPLAQDLLLQLQALAGSSPFVVPSATDPNKHCAPQQVTKALRQHCPSWGIDEHNRFTPHDLRRTVATMLSQEEVQREHIKAVLNHSFGDVAEVYINSGYVPQKSRYLDQWADKLVAILDDQERAENVIPFTG